MHPSAFSRPRMNVWICGAVVNQLRLGLRIDFTLRDQAQIARQARYAMTVDAAQISPDQAVRDGARTLRAGAAGNKGVANEARQLFVADFLAAHALLRSRGIC